MATAKKAGTPKTEIPIGGRIRATRLARGLTLGQVAAAAGLTEGFVSKLERDQVSPSVASLVAVCEALGLKVGELFDAPASAIVRAGDGAQINFGGNDAREFERPAGTPRRVVGVGLRARTACVDMAHVSVA